MKKFLQLFVLSILSLVAVSVSAQTYNDGVWYSFYKDLFDIYTIGEKSFDVFAPTQDSLRFSYEYAGGVTAVSPFQSQETDVYEFADASNMTHIGDADGIKRYDVYTSMPVSRNINKLLFKRDVGNTYGVNYKRVNVLMAKHILLAEGEYGTESMTYTFEPTQVGEVLLASVDLRSFLSAGDITISSDNPAFRVGSVDNTEALVWAVGANACASQNGTDGALAGGETLGDIDQYRVAIYFCPDYVKDYQGTITLTDGASTVTIAVTGTGYVEQKFAQEIIWEQDLAMLNVFDTILLNAEAKNEVTFALSDTTIASLEGNRLVLHNAGELEVYAYAAEDLLYLADTLIKTVTVNPLSQEIVWTLDTLVMTVGDSLVLNAVATSGLDVTYLTNVDSVVLIDDALLLALNPGEVVLTALQEGNNNYLAAQMEYTITVVAAQDDDEEEDDEEGDDVTTDLEDMLDSQVKVSKIIRDGKMYIIRDNQVYDILGTRL